MANTTILDRLKLELDNKQYLADEQYITLLNENKLDAGASYIKTDHQIFLLETVLDVMNILSNNTELMTNIETEFISTSDAYRYLEQRIDKVQNRIDNLRYSEVENSSRVRPLFFR